MATSTSGIGGPADGIAAFSGRSLDQNTETSRALKLARTINGVSKCVIEALGDDAVFANIQRLLGKDEITNVDVAEILQDKGKLALAVLLLKINSDIRDLQTEQKR